MRISLLTVLTAMLALICACGYRSSEAEYRVPAYAPRPLTDFDNESRNAPEASEKAGEYQKKGEYQKSREGEKAGASVATTVDPTDSRDLGPGA